MALTFMTDYKIERTIDGVPRVIEDGVVAVPTKTINRSWEDRLAQRPPDEMLDKARALVDAFLDETDDDKQADSVPLAAGGNSDICSPKQSEAAQDSKPASSIAVKDTAAENDGYYVTYESKLSSDELEKQKEQLLTLLEIYQEQVNPVITVDAIHHRLLINIQAPRGTQQERVIRKFKVLFYQGQNVDSHIEIDVTRLDNSQVREGRRIVRELIREHYNYISAAKRESAY